MEKQHCAICNTNELIGEYGEFLCLTCGYTTKEKYKIHNTIEIEQYEASVPKIISDLKQYDKKNNCNWYPTVVDFYKVGTVFPNGTKENWKWAFAPYIPIPLFARIKNPIGGDSDLYHEYALDFKNLIEYDKFEFKDAIKNLGDIYE
jgi:hypothetical protein